jgi:hypothetical protein
MPSTLNNNDFRRFKMTICTPSFNRGNRICHTLPRAGQQLEAFPQKSPFASPG